MDKKLILEAEVGRLFIELEKTKAAQQQLAQRINSILTEIEKLKDLSDGTKSN
jgi:uncharacterized coiled-coil protein SlyX